MALHIADHDPSGWDMTRDLEDRLRRFLEVDVALFIQEQWHYAAEEAMAEAQGYIAEKFTIKRIALNLGQVEEFNPPGQDVKPKDTRTPAYVKSFGPKCWELDALPPDKLADLIRQEVLALRDTNAWDQDMAREDECRRELQRIADGVAAQQNAWSRN